MSSEFSHSDLIAAIDNPDTFKEPLEIKVPGYPEPPGGPMDKEGLSDELEKKVSTPEQPHCCDKVVYGYLYETLAHQRDMSAMRQRNTDLYEMIGELRKQLLNTEETLTHMSMIAGTYAGIIFAVASYSLYRYFFPRI